MQYRRLGQSGLKVSALSFGAYVTFGTTVDQTLAMDLMSQAYDAGINFFDNAEEYEQGEAERLMGEALRRLAWTRDSYCVSSKVFWGGDKPTQLGLSRKHIHDACHASLKRLQVEYLDLFFCHRPDPETPIAETVRAMDVLVKQGKILYWGTSEWSAAQITEAHEFATQNYLTPPSMEQPQYNYCVRDRVEKEYAPLVEKYGMGLTTWSPLASGILSGKYNQGIPDNSRMALGRRYQYLRDRLENEEGQRRLAMARKLEVMAKDLGCTTAQLAIAWCLQNQQVSSVILGARCLKQLEENLKAIDVAQHLPA